jgi:K+-sensing histidine kinase KdpD
MLARLSKTLRGLGPDSLRAGSPTTHSYVNVEIIPPVVTSFALVLLATAILVAIDSYLAAPHLVLGYLLPTIIMMIYYSSTLALLTSFTSALAAAYFLLPPKFSFYVADLKHVAELGFFLMLASFASKAVARPARRGLPPQP